AWLHTCLSAAAFSVLPSCAAAPSQLGTTETLQDPPPSGQIVASAAVGAARGSMTVGADGSGRYSLPLDSPPGRLRIEPSPSLESSSNAGNSLVGLGWSLSGLSSIAPCGSSYGRDGKNRRVSLDAQDHLCLDGLRLVPVPGTTSEFRTDPDIQARIIADD